MKKQKLVALVLSGLLLIPTIGYAKGNPQNAEVKSLQTVSQEKTNNKQVDKENNGKVQKQKNEAKRDEKKLQIDAFKADMKIKHEAMKQVREDTKDIKKQIKTKIDQLQSIINDIKSGNKTLSEDMLNALMVKVDNLKTYSNEVKTTSGISEDVAKTQEKLNNKDFNNALSSMDKVIAKLQVRLDTLKKLSSALDDTLAIANLATTPVPETSTTPAAITVPAETIPNTSSN